MIMTEVKRELLRALIAYCFRSNCTSEAKRHYVRIVAVMRKKPPNE